MLLASETDPAAMIRQGMLDRGMPLHVADAFIMNFRDESGLRTDINEVAPIVPGSRGGFGLAQWTGPRRRELEAFAAQRGVPVSDMNAQLDFLMSELQGSEARAAQAIFAAPDTATAADAILRQFLRPAPEHRERRSAAYLGGQAPQQPQGGQTMPQGLLSPTVSSMNTQEPSIWDALVGRLPEGVQPIARRTIGDADWRDRMAIALAGMSTRPNQAIIGTLQDRMESRDEDRRMNQTVAYLESIGRPDLAAAIAAGLPAGDAIGAALAPAPPPNLEVADGGLVLDMNSGAVVADYRAEEGADPTAAIQNYQYLLGQGVPEEEARERAFGSNAPQVTTNVNTGGESAFDVETGKILAQEASTVVEQGALAQRSLGQLATLESALAAAPEGAAGALTSFANQLGIKTENSSAIEVAEAIISQLVPQQRPPGSGVMSDADLELFKRSLPQLVNTREGNQRIIQTMRAIAEYDVARMQIARELQLRRIGPEEAFAAYNRLGNPLADFVRESANPPPAAPPAPGVSPDVQRLLDQYAPVQ